MDPVGVAVLVSAAAIAAATVLGAWISDRRRALTRRLGKVRRVQIRDARDGERVRVVGRVVAVDAPLRGWLVEHALAWHSCEVRRTGRPHGVLSERFERTTFMIEDESGALLVARTAPTRFVIDHGPPELLTVPERDTNDPRVAQMLPSDAEAAHMVRVIEKWIPIGSTVAVIGMAHTVRDTAIGLFRGSAPRLELTGTDREPLFVSDDDAVLR